MGKQSARITKYQGGQPTDHKDIIGQAADGTWYHHDKLFYCDDELKLHLVWEKLKEGGSEVIESPFYISSRNLATRNATTMYYDLHTSTSIYAYDERLQTRRSIEHYPEAYNGQEYFSLQYRSDDLISWRQMQHRPVFTNYGTKYFHNVEPWIQWNATLQKTEIGIRHQMYSIQADSESPTYSYFVTCSLIIEWEYINVVVDKGCFGDVMLVALYERDKKDVSLFVLNGNELYHTIFKGEFLNKITRENPLLYYYNVFYGQTFAYMLTNKEDTTRRTLYRIGQSGTHQEYSFDVGTTEFLSLYVYRDRFAVMCAENTDTIYLYDIDSETVTSRKFDGYHLKFYVNQGGLANICYENGNGLNIVLENNISGGRTALAILDL